MNNKTTIQSLKGFRDFLPAEAQKRQWLKNKLISIFERWGYDPMETPTLESLELFKGQIGEEENLFFQFEDQGGRQVAMRYDQTVPTCRVVGQYFQQLPMPFRRYQIQPAFRAEKPQKGRYREFVQCDADIFGTSSPLADAEVIALSLDIFRQLGFKEAKVLINDRTLLKDLPYEAIVAIDKLKKIGQEGVIKAMEAKGISAEKAKEYLTVVENLQPNENIKIIFDYLDNLGFDKDWYQFDPTISRSFSYSSGPIWEVEIPGIKGGSVLGGERFDQLTERVSGLDVPGTGFGLGFDRTLEALEELNLIPDFKTSTQVLVTIFNQNLISNSIKIANNLRQNNINTELYPNQNDKLQKQLRYANKKGIPFVVVIGENEVNQNKLTLKNMISGEQLLLSLEDMISLINAQKS